MRAALFPLLVLIPAAALASPVFGPGEQTTYEVSYLGVRAGTAQLTVGWPTEKEGHTVWPLVCAGQTTGVTSVFPIHDKFVSWWDPREGLSVAADLFADENRKRRVEHFAFDFRAGQATVTRKHEGQPPSARTFSLQEGSLDLAAAAFALRNQPLEPGSTVEVPIFTGHKTFMMKAKVEGRETLETPLGRLPVLRLSVSADFSGKLATQKQITVFYTADDKQLPVHAEAEFLLGKVVLEATHYEPGSTPAGVP